MLMADQTSKPFKKYGEMLDLLESRNVTIDDRSNAEYVIKNIPYYTLINNYKNIFVSIDESGKYTDDYQGTKFDHIKETHDFDRDLCSIFYKYISMIENTLKSVLSYNISEEFGYIKSDYFNGNNYSLGNPVKNRNGVVIKNQGGKIYYDRDKLLEKLKEKYNSNKSDVVCHYRVDHGNVPPWILVTELSLGEIINWLKQSKGAVKDNVMLHYIMLDKLSEAKNNYSFFSQCLYVVLEYRNIVSHGGRVLLHCNKRKFDCHLLKEYIPCYSNGMKRNKVGRTDLMGLIYAMIALFSNRSTVREEFIDEITSCFLKMKRSNEEVYNKILERNKIKQKYIDDLQTLK